MKHIIFSFTILLSFCVSAAAEEPLRVVTTLSSFQSLVEAVGGDAVEVSTVVPPRFNAHSFEPRPSDVLRVKRADLFVHAGLDLEAWRDPLINASARSDFKRGGKGEVDLSSVVTLLNIPSGIITRAQGDIHLFGNPHYWLSPENGLKMASLIAERLSEKRPAHTAQFRANLEKFSHALRSKEAEWKQEAAPYRGKELVGYHDEWVYLTDFLGLQMDLFLESKPGIAPGPQHISEVQDAMTSRGIKVIGQASFYSRSTADYVAKNTGAKVVLLCQNVRELPGCEDYIKMLDYNITSIVDAL